MTVQTRDRYGDMFERLRAENRRALIPFTVLGWPDRDTSFRIMRTMIEAGASALELGLAFSDPMADGPIIQQAAKETLERGFRVDDALGLLKDVRALDARIPIGLLVYYNLVLARTAGRFFADVAEAGADAVLIADLPPESMHEVKPAADAAGIRLIPIVSPLTSEARMPRIAEVAGGFLYVVSRLGITGVEERYDDTLRELLSRARRHSPLPACVGFGISKPEHARHMTSLGADGVIVGSRIIQLMRETPHFDCAPLHDYLQAMSVACRNQAVG